MMTLSVIVSELMRWRWLRSCQICSRIKGSLPMSSGLTMPLITRAFAPNQYPDMSSSVEITSRV